MDRVDLDNRDLPDFSGCIADFHNDYDTVRYADITHQHRYGAPSASVARAGTEAAYAI
jgi:hypothetical protein